MLTWAGWQLEPVSSNGDESMLKNESPEQYVRRVAEIKSRLELPIAAEIGFVF